MTLLLKWWNIFKLTTDPFIYGKTQYVVYITTDEHNVHASNAHEASENIRQFAKARRFKSWSYGKSFPFEPCSIPPPKICCLCAQLDPPADRRKVEFCLNA